jgi:hypothetical protein
LKNSCARVRRRFQGAKDIQLPHVFKMPRFFVKIPSKKLTFPFAYQYRVRQRSGWLHAARTE